MLKTESEEKKQVKQENKETAYIITSTSFVGGLNSQTNTHTQTLSIKC